MGTPYASPSLWPGWNVHTTFHHDFEGQLAFLHRTQDKWRLDGLNVRSTVPGEPFALHALAQLRTRWSGTPWLNGNPTAEEQQGVERWIGGQIVLGDGRVLRLERDQKVMGMGDWFWSFFLDQGNPILAICTAERPLLRCSQTVGGKWQASPLSPASILIDVRDVLPPRAAKPPLALDPVAFAGALND